MILCYSPVSSNSCFKKTCEGPGEDSAVPWQQNQNVFQCVLMSLVLYSLNSEQVVLNFNFALVQGGPPKIKQ